MDLIKKEEILKNIEDNISNTLKFSKEELEILNMYSEDSDEFIRCKVAEILIDFTNEQGENILKKLVKDKSSVVRIEACDSLSPSSSFETVELLKEVIESDKNGLVRGYAINSLGEIAVRLNIIDEIDVFLKKYLVKERVIVAKINLYKVLYSFGNEEYLILLLNLLSTKRYQNRCSVVNCLVEVINENNKEFIKEHLITHKESETAFAVNSIIERALSEL